MMWMIIISLPSIFVSLLIDTLEHDNPPHIIFSASSAQNARTTKETLAPRRPPACLMRQFGHGCRGIRLRIHCV
ncbi:hypothetical protein DFH08DRAFT_450083 [Mycena albidolilacea]|uniref:Secreted protein n=1 Tax=Mycena albidolilacea TaxID=1033008 RepID=A0AAD7ED78_9AGAR|nr:hypothetical protein DFH08DRAFT_450083 [Mycena albidolilacea]